jgi:hypothetical protein
VNTARPFYLEVAGRATDTNPQLKETKSMPYVKSLRDTRIDTLDSHVIQAPARTPKYVPASALPRAFQLGCVECTEDGTLLLDQFATDPKLPVDGIPRLAQEEREDPTKRQHTLTLAIAKLYNDNDKAQFTTGNVPRVRSVESLVGFPTSGAEVAQALEAYHANV